MESNAPEPEVAEARKLSEALAQLRQAAGPSIRAEAAASEASLPPDEDLADAKALEEDSLSSWVASTRAAAIADAKAWEEDALKNWVSSVRAAAIPSAKAEPRKKAPRKRKEPAKKRARANATQARAATAGGSSKASKRGRPQAPEPGSGTALEPNPTRQILRSTLGMTNAASLEDQTSNGADIVFGSALRNEVPGRIQRDLVRLRRALAWHWLDLLQRAAPAERVRWMGRTFATLGRAVGYGLGRVARAAGRLLLRGVSAAARPPLRFISDLDLPGLIGLLLALLGVVTAAALLIRT